MWILKILDVLYIDKFWKTSEQILYVKFIFLDPVFTQHGP